MKPLRFLLVAVAFAIVAHLHATPPGTAFTFQGRLNDGTNPANGSYDFRFSVYAAPGNSPPLGDPITNSPVEVSNGLFTVTLDFGAGIFTGASRWLGIEVHTNDLNLAFVPLTPRQAILPTPYAIYAGGVEAAGISGVIPAASISGSYSNAVNLTNVNNTFAGNGTGLTNVNAATLGGLSASNFWKLGGNAGTAAGTHFLGTTDNQPLEIKVNGLRALRIEDNGDGSDPGSTPDGAPNVIGGSPVNFVGAGVVGATIAGGGATNAFGLAYTNAVLSDYGVVGGGLGNHIAANSPESTIAGGVNNDIGANSYDSAIGGGFDNNIANGSTEATIAGGNRNDIGANSARSAIGGGDDNNIAANSLSATIAGGYLNAIGTNSDYSTIGGGHDNDIANGSTEATIAGGSGNVSHGLWTAIGGGEQNFIQAAFLSTISGGWSNGIFASYSFIGGGELNQIIDSDLAMIGGGLRNVVGGSGFADTIDHGASSNGGAIAGGLANGIEANAAASTIGGGANNRIRRLALNSTIAGGYLNSIGTNSSFSVIGGGTNNTIAANSLSATIAGGSGNDIGTNSPYSAIGGGLDNNIAANSTNAAIAGGSFNYIGSGYATIAGGNQNRINANSIMSAIGGGYLNYIAANSQYATIPGGLENVATNYSFAAGTRAYAIHTGAFVWGDSTVADIASTSADSVTMRASGGYRLFSNSGATAGVSLAAGGTAWAVISDRNVKKDFAPLDSRRILEKLAAMPITQWHYQWEAPDVTLHIGPMAQDFKAAFYPGTDDKSITTLEADGVALAAIQGLNEKVESGKQKAEFRIEKLEAENAGLRGELGELKSLVKSMNEKLSGGTK